MRVDCRNLLGNWIFYVHLSQEDLVVGLAFLVVDIIFVSSLSLSRKIVLCSPLSESKHQKLWMPDPFTKVIEFPETLVFELLWKGWPRNGGRAMAGHFFFGCLSGHFKWNLNWCSLLGSASLILEEGLYSGWKFWSGRAVPARLSLPEVWNRDLWHQMGCSRGGTDGCLMCLYYSGWFWVASPWFWSRGESSEWWLEAGS